MKRQLFGTDGIRGRAGEYPLDPATATAFGKALGEWSSRHLAEDGTNCVLIGMDTRESGHWLAECVAGGLQAAGASFRFAGIITTPGVAWLTRNRSFTAGVMISASHNPYEDNGLKVFDHSGYKLPDEQELELEQAILAHHASGEVLKGKPEADASLDAAYIDSLVAVAGDQLRGMKLVLDCAHGAAYEIAPVLFRRLGAEVTVLHNEPNGRNINADCGALHIEKLQAQVLAVGADAGAAFDGDADRCILVSHDGKEVNGDAVLMIAARRMKMLGRLPGDRVVATVMSNMGLELVLQQDGIALGRTKVGDKYVLEEMRAAGNSLGGEQSGHVIFSDYATTGDGMLTALSILSSVCESRRPLADLAADLKLLPQILRNIRVKARKPLRELPATSRAIAACEENFAGKGRVLVRYSGTELLARVMVEGPEQQEVEKWTSHICDVLAGELATA
jgi:phosphoglucosamine mutase